MKVADTQLRSTRQAIQGWSRPHLRKCQPLLTTEPEKRSQRTEAGDDIPLRLDLLSGRWLVARELCSCSAFLKIITEKRRTA